MFLYVNKCTLGVKKELGNEKACMHAGCIENIMSPYVNVQYWEIQESIWIVRAFQEDDSNFLPAHHACI